MKRYKGLQAKAVDICSKAVHQFQSNSS